MTAILDNIRSLLDAPAATLRAQEALQRTMTGRVLMQPPVMTSAHIVALHTMRSLWPYPTAVDLALIDDIRRHLECLLDAPVPTSHPGGILDDWRTEYAAIDPECFQSDQ